MNYVRETKIKYVLLICRITCGLLVISRQQTDSLVIGRPGVLAIQTRCSALTSMRDSWPNIQSCLCHCGGLSVVSVFCNVWSGKTYCTQWMVNVQPESPLISLSSIGECPQFLLNVSWQDGYLKQQKRALGGEASLQSILRLSPHGCFLCRICMHTIVPVSIAHFMHSKYYIVPVTSILRKYVVH
jgi:hypothetical protein